MNQPPNAASRSILGTLPGMTIAIRTRPEQRRGACQEAKRLPPHLAPSPNAATGRTRPIVALARGSIRDGKHSLVDIVASAGAACGPSRVCTRRDGFISSRSMRRPGCRRAFVLIAFNHASTWSVKSVRFSTSFRPSIVMLSQRREERQPWE